MIHNVNIVNIINIIHMINMINIDMSEIINKLDPYSTERDAFEAVVMGEASELPLDPEGRITLPQYLVEYAELDRKVYFVGKGRVFEIWNPNHFEEYFFLKLEINLLINAAPTPKRTANKIENSP